MSPPNNTTRLDRIEANLEQVTEALKASIASQTRSNQSTQEALQAVAASQVGLNAAIAKYVDAADARMRRIEENLDGLIRAITAEHSNGKNKLPGK